MSQPEPGIRAEAANGRVHMVVEKSGEDVLLFTLTPAQARAWAVDMLRLERLAREQAGRTIREGVG